MNYDSYLARAIEIFNDKMDADFSRDNVIFTSYNIFVGSPTASSRVAIQLIA